jgi:hypothetical protein
MKRCAVCNSLMAGGFRDGEASFCSLYCYTQSPVPGFCEQCLSETTDVSPGGTFTFDMIGTGMFGAADRCRNCHSVIQGKWIQILFPVWRLAKYRVRYVGPKNYVGRRLSRTA